jgi:hypothetical protein
MEANTMNGERFYVAYDSENSQNIVIGWNLKYEPDQFNECGYSIVDGPFATEQEAKDAQ